MSIVAMGMVMGIVAMGTSAVSNAAIVIAVLSNNQLVLYVEAVIRNHCRQGCYKYSPL